MANKTFQIKIESILGGVSQSSVLGAEEQYRLSLGIDPAFPVSDESTGYAGNQSSGLIRPVAVFQVTNTMTAAPIWVASNPKDKYYYVAGHDGSIYSYDGGGSLSLSGISDGGNESGSSSGNGMAYYDNYMYFARNTTIARYGPLDGTATLNGDYWGTTLGKTALEDTEYVRGATVPGGQPMPMPNHVMHRHSDGRLYIADVVGNQGTIHYIQTTKTTVEGDTDDGSTYDALDLGFGLYPTAMASYGDYLVIALWEGGPLSTAFNPSRHGKAKIAFWDTTSSSPNLLIWSEFPDEFINALENANGVLYVVSSSQTSGFRLSRYVGGSSFETVFISKTANPPYPGGVVSIGDQLMFGSFLFTSDSGGEAVVFSYKTNNPSIGDGVFPLYSTKGASWSNVGLNMVTAMAVDVDGDRPLIAWGNLFGGGINGGALEVISSNNFNSGSGSLLYSNNTQFWESKQYNIGQPFKITKIRIPLAQPVPNGAIMTPTVYFDEEQDSKTLTQINYTNYPDKKNIVIKPENATGQHSFYLRFDWTGTKLLTVTLPITIEYELIDD